MISKCFNKLITVKNKVLNSKKTGFGDFFAMLLIFSSRYSVAVFYQKIGKSAKWWHSFFPKKFKFVGTWTEKKEILDFVSCEKFFCLFYFLILISKNGMDVVRKMLAKFFMQKVGHKNVRTCDLLDILRVGFGSIFTVENMCHAQPHEELCYLDIGKNSKLAKFSFEYGYLFFKYSSESLCCASNNWLIFDAKGTTKSV